MILRIEKKSSSYDTEYRAILLLTDIEFASEWKEVRHHAVRDLSSSIVMTIFRSCIGHTDTVLAALQRKRDPLALAALQTNFNHALDMGFDVVLQGYKKHQDTDPVCYQYGSSVDAMLNTLPEYDSLRIIVSRTCTTGVLQGWYDVDAYPGLPQDGRSVSLSITYGGDQVLDVLGELYADSYVDLSRGIHFWLCGCIIDGYIQIEEVEVDNP